MRSILPHLEVQETRPLCTHPRHLSMRLCILIDACIARAGRYGRYLLPAWQQLRQAACGHYYHAGRHLLRGVGGGLDKNLI